MNKVIQNTTTIKPRDIILDRREKVAIKHWIYRKSIRQIAKELDYTPKTIWKDLQCLKKQFKEQTIVIDKNDLLKTILFQRNYNLQKLAKLRDRMSKYKNASEERRVIQLIENINSQNIKDMQELEFIDKPKERQEIEHKSYKFIIEDESKKDGIKKRTNKLRKYRG